VSARDYLQSIADIAREMLDWDDDALEAFGGSIEDANGYLSDAFNGVLDEIEPIE
jgi:hypothetical protein